MTNIHTHKGFRTALCIGVLVAAAIAPATAQMSTDIVSPGAAKGDLTNWTAGYIQVEARGTAKATSNKIQMELLAIEGARLLAEVKLLKAIQSVRIIGTTTMANFTETNVKLASKVEGVVKGAITVKEEVEWVPDNNSPIGESPNARVVLRMCFRSRTTACTGAPRGGGLLNLLPKQKKLVPKSHDIPLRPAPAPKKAEPQPAPPPPEAPKAKMPAPEDTKSDQPVVKKVETMIAKAAPPPPPKPKAVIAKPFTGLVLNMLEFDYLPALAPQIRTEKGQAIYDPRVVSKKHAIRYGFAEYVSSLDAARKLKRFGDNPLVIEPEDIDEDNNIVVSEADAERIAQANAGGGEFLKDAKVAIVLQNQ